MLCFQLINFSQFKENFSIPLTYIAYNLVKYRTSLFEFGYKKKRLNFWRNLIALRGYAKILLFSLFCWKRNFRDIFINFPTASTIFTDDIK